MTTATKPIWHAEGSQVYEGDKLIGNYASPESAQYVARLHNNHQSGNFVLCQIDEMLQSEIDFAIEGSIWHGGITWQLGRANVPSPEHGNAPTIEEALIALRNTARRHFPESLFSQRNGFDLKLQTDQRTAEDVAYELGKLGEFTTHFDPTDTAGPDAAPWTVEVNGKKFGGITLIEAMKFAIEYNTGQKMSDPWPD